MASASTTHDATPAYAEHQSVSNSELLQPYAAMKRGSETLLHSHHSLYDTGIGVVRYCSVHNPSGRPDLTLLRFVDGLNNVVEEALMMMRLNSGHEVIPINDLMKLVKELTGRKADVQYHPPNITHMFTNWASLAKARQMSGWINRTDSVMARRNPSTGTGPNLRGPAGF